MILPEYFIEDEYCAEILWRISSDEKVLHNLRCSVVNEGLKIHTIEKKIPVRVCQNYTVSLLDPESADGGRKLREDWNITGSGERRFMLFDYKGKQRTDQTYPMDGGVLLLNQDCHAEFVSTWYNELFQSIEVDYATMEFLPKDNSSCIRIDDEEGTCLRVRKSIKTELQGGRLLFADAVSSDKTPIFTELPDFGFVSEESTHLSVLIRNRDTGYKNSFSLEDEFFHTEEHTTWKYYNLKNFLPEGSGYGRYVMRIYEQGNFKKEMEFAFVPEIEFDNCDISLWPEPKGMASSAFRYRLRQGIQIDFSSSVKSSNEICEGEVWKRLEALDNNDFLEGVLLLEEERIRIPFKKRIKGLQWAVWNWDNAELNYSDDINKISKAEYQSESWYLTMRSAPENMKEDGLKLCLYSSSNELIQEYPVIPNQRGVWQLDLGVFAVSIENCKLPAELRFARKREGSEYRILKIYEPVMMEGLQIKKGAVPQRLIWTKSNIEDIEERLSIQSLTDYDEECRAFEHIQCVEDECGKTYFYIILEPPLRNSIYKVAYSKPDDDFFDFSEYCIEALPDCNTFMVNPADELNKIKSKGISEFVKAITISYRSLEPLKKLEVILDERIDGIMGRLLENDLKQIAALTLYAIRDEQGECEIIIRNLLSKIYDELMQSAEKQCLYQLLMRTESTDIEKNKARHFFRMDYLSLKGIDYSQQDIKRLLRSDVFLGLRGLLIQPKGRWMAEPLINYIGIEALSNLIKFEDKDESRISLFEKWLLGEEIPYKIELNDNLIGNSNTFYEMFEWGRGYNKPKLNMDKKPKNELIFWGSGYIQLLIRWYYQGIDKHPQELNAAKKLAPTIDRLLSKSAAGADSVIKAYSRRICCRETESKSGFYPVLKASAACGMLIALEEQSKLHLLPEDKRTLTEFMYLMDEVFPELLKRDILLAQLYLFVTEV